MVKDANVTVSLDEAAIEAKRESAKAEIRKNAQLEGWLTSEYRSGKYPIYSYPPNELPKIKNATMSATVGFMSAN